ncbi:MFS transporter [Rhodoferax sp.]|uniref:MFS transporter n=1 Tax=Rhodoferax sp. TaxID=50421 RepID=UPI002ACD3C16|nr:MFS transporter [Rhodoferax sp.]MDZ7919370.1 MFS transporter [Rhodoferax sp.]
MVATVVRPMTGEEKHVIFASSLGTVFEWYDFYLYGALAGVIARQFFSGLDDSSAFIFALLAFSAGFVVRPFGALVFGRLGDMVGRKYTFLITILIMGLSTFIVGVLPSYSSIGVAAPVILIGLRLMQGLALGGEYGGAATYVAEHSPPGKRGAYTAWIQTTATLGLLLSLMVILGTRKLVGEQAFSEWAWRIPFLLSLVMLGISVYIRLRLNESPAFIKMKAEGKTSQAPLSDSFGQWHNLKVVIYALFGLTAGQAVIWYTGQFYALLFLTHVLAVDETTAILMVAISLVIGAPFFVLFGALSDRFGRKPIILAGCLLATLTYLPAFEALTKAANPDLHLAQKEAKVVVYADPAECSFQFNPTETKKFTSSCDVAKQRLARASVSYANAASSSGSLATILIGGNTVKVNYSTEEIEQAKLEVRDRIVAMRKEAAVDESAVAASRELLSELSIEKTASAALFNANVTAALRGAGYPEKADMAEFEGWVVVIILTYLIVLAAMVYGPIAAMLVEMFPTRIRYTSMSLPYHIGNGWIGGLLPTTVFAIVAQTGNIYNGLWYPIIIAASTVVIGALFIKETKDVDIQTLP